MAHRTPQKECYYIQQHSPDATSTSCEENEEGFEFDVQPKRKYFDTIQEKKQYIEEYTKKKKTELCKNFTLTGQCRYGKECSFAHGQSELQPKIHLHQKYKTKPCKRFFRHGYCPYGNRCQYIHGELKDINKPEFERYLSEVFKELSLPQPTPIKQLKKDERFDLQRFTQTLKKHQLRADELFVFGQSRLSTFLNFSENRKSIQKEENYCPNYCGEIL